MISVILLNQKVDMRVNILPLPGIGSDMITSKADILSVATMRRLSSNS